MHIAKGIPLIYVYSHAKSPLCCFRSVTRHSISSALILGLMFNVFLESTSTRTLLELSITRINSILMTKDSSVSSSYYRSFIMIPRIWYVFLLTDVGSLIKLQMVSCSVSILKVKDIPIVNKGWISSSYSKSIHNRVLVSMICLAGGYKVRFLRALPY